MTRLPADLEIEELSQRSWERIERGVFAELDLAVPLPVVASDSVAYRVKRQTRWRPALAMVAVAAAAVWFVAVRDNSTVDALRSSRVVTGDAPSHVTVPGAALVVGKGSALVWSGDNERGVHVTLEAGEVECVVVPRDDRPPFVVQAGDVRMEVMGTRFSVAREAGSAKVTVIEGTIRILAGDKTAVLNAGDSWPTQQQEPPSAESDEEVEDGPFELTFRRDVLAPSRRTLRARRNRLAKGPAPAAAAPEIGPQAPRSASERYRLASQLEPSDPRAAIAIYRELTKHAPEWAANALFAHGRLEFDRGLHNNSRSLLRAYLRRFPRGANAEDARHLLRQLK